MQRGIALKVNKKLKWNSKNYSNKLGENKGGIQKTENKMIGLNPTMSIITLNVQRTH